MYSTHWPTAISTPNVQYKFVQKWTMENNRLYVDTFFLATVLAVISGKFRIKWYWVPLNYRIRTTRHTRVLRFLRRMYSTHWPTVISTPNVQYKFVQKWTMENNRLYVDTFFLATVHIVISGKFRIKWYWVPLITVFEQPYTLAYCDFYAECTVQVCTKMNHGKKLQYVEIFFLQPYLLSWFRWK
jgi:hypothetical protein